MQNRLHQKLILQTLIYTHAVETVFINLKSMHKNDIHPTRTSTILVHKCIVPLSDSKLKERYQKVKNDKESIWGHKGNNAMQSSEDTVTKWRNGEASIQIISEKQL